MKVNFWIKQLQILKLCNIFYTEKTRLTNNSDFQGLDGYTRFWKPWIQSAYFFTSLGLVSLYLCVSQILWTLKSKNKCTEIHDTSFAFEPWHTFVRIRFRCISSNKWCYYANFFYYLRNNYMWVSMRQNITKLAYYKILFWFNFVSY